MSVKPPKTVSEQIVLLKKRGMIFSNEDFACDCLTNIGYYRLSGYWYKFQNKYKNQGSENKEDFTTSVCFEEIAELYRFDTKLRSLFFDALEKIEISFSARLGNLMSCQYGADWYVNENLFFDKKHFDNNLKEVFRWIETGKDKQPVKAYFENHPTERFLPFWIVGLVIPFGTLSKLYGNLKSEYQKEIAKQFDMTAPFLLSAMRCLTDVRNICAHYNRLWDARMKIKSKKINNPTKLGIFNYTFRQDGFFEAFYLISLFLVIIAPQSKFCTLIDELISRYEARTGLKMTYEKAGFPKDWKALPLFRVLLKNKR